jgi:hypothetical protein
MPSAQRREVPETMPPRKASREVARARAQGQLRENRNLSLSIRAKAVLIYVLSVPVHNVI